MIKLFHRILCPVTFDDNSLAAVKFARTLAEQNDATVILLNVTPFPLGAPELMAGPLEPYPPWEEPSERKLGEVASEQLQGKVRYEIAARRGDPASGIVRAADELGVDLIVMATHGRTGVSHLFLGSVAERVVRESSKPVLTLRPH